MIIWVIWLFDAYLWLFILDYLMIIWWLFVLNYSWLWYAYLIIIRSLLWLFDDYSLSMISEYFNSTPAAACQQVGWQASFSEAFAQHRGTSLWWQPVPVGLLQTVSCSRSYSSCAITSLSYLPVSTCQALCPTEAP